MCLRFTAGLGAGLGLGRAGGAAPCGRCGRGLRRGLRRGSLLGLREAQQLLLVDPEEDVLESRARDAVRCDTERGRARLELPEEAGEAAHVLPGQVHLGLQSPVEADRSGGQLALHELE